MKKNLTIFALIAVIGVCFSIVSKNLFVPEDDGYVSERERRMIKRFDKDGDGQLSREEERAARAAMEAEEAKEKAEWLERFDKDGDGKISREEKEAAGEARKKRALGKRDGGGKQIRKLERK